jgi:type IV pilus assembly protein PilY1
MRSTTRKTIDKVIAITTLFCMTTQGALGAYLDLADQPLFIGANVPPQVMLTISKEQQLYRKAYNDYSDLDEDGQLETTYKHDIDYYGYFDSYKCYSYDGAKFVPAKDNSGSRNTTTDDKGKPTAAAIEDNKKLKYCATADKLWSGNFLNWVSMSRMDTVRKLLYGGMRSTDDETATVLERAHFPTDAHAWAKYYNGPDIATLTPFDPATVTKPFKAATAQVNTFCTTTSTSTTICFPGPFGFPICFPVVFAGGTPAPTAALFEIPPRVLQACPSPIFEPVLDVPTPSAPLSATNPQGDVDVMFATAMDGEMSLGDQVRFEIAATSRGTSVSDCSGGTTPCLLGTVIGFSNANMTVRVRANFAGVFGAGSGDTVQVTNLSRTGISFCNVTFPKSGTTLSHSNLDAPLIRAARGNFHLWNASQRFQCFWRSEHEAKVAELDAKGTPLPPFDGPGRNGNVASLSGINASADNPSQAEHALPGGDNGDFIARVAVCVDGLFGTERCKQYPKGNYKPVGLLQEYGDNNLIQFGLMTGSYAKNISGGVLRKNIGTFTDEVDLDDKKDGRFKTPAVPPGASLGTARSATAGPTPAGIVNTLNYIKIRGYNYGDGTYLGSAGDNCAFQLTNITENNCTSWGNPMSEIYFESLRYFAGNAPAFSYTSSGSKDNQLGLPLPAWADPVNKNNYCAPLNTLVFNASVSTNDDDLRTISAASINSTKTVAQLTDFVGGAEGINGGSYFIGKLVGATPTPSSDAGFELCTPKTIPGLGDVSGICPEGPTVAGSYLIAGLAHHARTNRIRTNIDIPSNDARSLKVTTYGIQLATNVPTIVLPVPGSTTGQKVVIQPIYRLRTGSGALGGGTLVDLKFIKPIGPDPLDPTNPNKSYGKIYLNWEDSEQGGDFDQDMWGTLEWRLDASVSPATIRVTTNAISESTNQQQGFGYAISGTDADGPHFHSGIEGFNYKFGSPPVDECVNCQVLGKGGQSGERSRDYKLGSSTGKTLQDPLWYAAKYGAFIDSNPTAGVNPVPDVQSEWDSKLANGQQGSDGIPDTYFLVTNPLGLVAALDRAFVAILSNASASSVATNSTSLQTGTTIYQARFNANDWSGQVLAFTVDANGKIATDPSWDAGKIINFQDPTEGAAPPAKAAISTDVDVIAGAGRAIITMNGRLAVPFTWPANPSSLQATDIPQALVDNLNLSTPFPAPIFPATATPDGRGKERLAWLRGSKKSEGAGTSSFRVRPISKLGDIVNSNPNFVGLPNAGFGDDLYTKFRLEVIDRERESMIYVGGNDGMLHAFRAKDGRELLAFIPSMVHNRLNTLTGRGYVGNEHRYYVDGSPEVGDAFFKAGTETGASWRTVLVSALGGGGQGLFALDVTRPEDFSEANASKIALWEFSDKDDPDLGFIYAQPTIRRMANGKFAAIVPGGYNHSKPEGGEKVCTDSTSRTPTGCTTNTTGSAYLFIIFLDGPGADGVWDEGKDYVKIRAAHVDDTAGTPNGLSQPLAADVDADGFIDFIYAGDLRGNLWKFDVRLPPNPPPAPTVPPSPPVPPLPNTSALISQWTSSDNRVILFVAKTPDETQTQPITSKPEATLHPTQGFIVTFGTGKYIEKNDPYPPAVTPPTTPVYQPQSFYGIWDKNDAGDEPIAKQTVVTSRNQLLPQQIVNFPGNEAIRIIVPLVTGKKKPEDTTTALLDSPLWSGTLSSTPPEDPPVADDSPTSDPLSKGRHMGWRLEFPGTGERSVFRPILTSGRLIFTTLLPLTEACLFGGDSFTMVIDPVNGGMINAAVLDVDGTPGLDNKLDSVVYNGTTYFASGVKSTIGITPTPTIIRAGSLPPDSTSAGSKLLGTSGPLIAAQGVLLAYALAAGSSGGNASTMIGLSAAGGRVSWREITAD